MSLLGSALRITRSARRPAAIEPMLTLGGIDYEMWPDNWTAVPKDRRRTAQFEHTVLVTDDGAATIHREHGAIDEAGLRGEEERDGVADLLAGPTRPRGCRAAIWASTSGWCAR